jgi:1-deoxy-D-xylulose-5-phosphate reductoisomerase
MPAVHSKKSSARPKRLVLLGATGSIGESTLKVVRKHPDRLQIVAIAGRARCHELDAIAREFHVAHVGVFDEAAAKAARKAGLFKGCTVHVGPKGLEELARLPEGDMVVAAVVGTLGLKPTLAAIEAGKDIALANKEILVLAGRFVMEAARARGVTVVPLDSEHNAVFQCLDGERPEDVAKLLLTASGGPFRDYTLAQMAAVEPAAALRHPNWDMGPKVTIDSSTMANKGLEVIEAHWLFGLPAERIQVVVHPQSIVHSMVQFVDGSILAQLSPPSMTFPIQHSLLYPERAAGVNATLDFSQLLRLDFHPPDLGRFPCLRLAYAALRAEGAAPAAFNAANEIAVAAFLEGRLNYLDIPRVIEATLSGLPAAAPRDLDEVLAADAAARRRATDWLKTAGRPSPKPAKKPAARRK